MCLVVGEETGLLLCCEIADGEKGGGGGADEGDVYRKFGGEERGLLGVEILYVELVAEFVVVDGVDEEGEVFEGL